MTARNRSAARSAALALSRSRISRAEALAERLATRIDADRLASGTRLGTKEDLRVAYGVAPSTVNEALGLLRASGLVEVRSGPGGGVFVAEPAPFVRMGHKLLWTRHQPITVADCIAVRFALEALVVEEATRHASAADKAALREVVEIMDRTVGDNLQFARANWSLHRRMAGIGPNRVLAETYVGLLDLIERETTEIVADTDYSELGAYRVEIHRQLVEAVASGDVATAAAAERAHRAFAQSSS